MNYTNLGKTGLKVSRICLGCISYGLTLLLFREGKLKGKAYQASGNGTDIFVNKDEKWRLVSHHATEFKKIVPAQ